MSEFETKLRWLSERGNPVGAEDLIERIEAELAGDPLVVVAKRREGTIMTKTQQRPTTGQPSRNWGPVWGAAVFAAILAVAALYFAFTNDSGEVADNPPPTTVAPEVETMTDLQIIEAGVAAVYSGDADRAAELFELEGLTDEEIHQEAAYQAAIDGRLTLNCTELSTPGVFTCNVPYHNGLTDAVGYVDSPGDTNRVVVNDGVITTFEFPEHTGMLVSVAAYLGLELGSEVPEECFVFGPFPETCATIHIENLDGWATFYKSEWPGLEPGLMSELEGVFETEACDGPSSECRAAMYQVFSSWVADHSVTSDLEVIEAGVAAVYSGDADRAAELFELEASSYGDDPLTDEEIRGVAAYQKAIGGRLTLDCTERQTLGEFTCRVPYHNAMTDAIGFTDGGDTNSVVVKDGVITTFGFPEHSGMLVSVAAYLARELGGVLPEECRHWYSPFSETCVAIQLENLDGWAAFYQTEWPEHGDALINQIDSIFKSDVCQQGTIEECDRAHYRAIADWAADQK